MCVTSKDNSHKALPNNVPIFFWTPNDTCAAHGQLSHVLVRH